jgi:hypothetical protein
VQITIENTSQIVEVNGSKCRVWIGETESGIKVECIVCLIAVRRSEDTSQFESELFEQPAPFQSEAFPLRMILQ